MKSICEIDLPDEEATMNLGVQLSAIVPDEIVIYLHGELGAGKTTFVRGFLRGLQYTGKVKSPTYTLVEPYTIQHKHIYHFDLYRLLDPRELYFVGIRDYMASSICLIEWPEKGKGFLPSPDLDCTLEIKEQGRVIILIAETTRGRKILAELSKFSYCRFGI